MTDDTPATTLAELQARLEQQERNFGWPGFCSIDLARDALALATRLERENALLREQLSKPEVFMATHAIATDCLNHGCAHGERLEARTRQVERWQHAAHGGCSSGPDGALLCAPASPGDFARAVHERDRERAEHCISKDMLGAQRDDLFALRAQVQTLTRKRDEAYRHDEAMCIDRNAALARLQTAESALAILRPTCNDAIRGQQGAHQGATDLLARLRVVERERNAAIAQLRAREVTLAMKDAAIREGVRALNEYGRIYEDQDALTDASTLADALAPNASTALDGAIGRLVTAAQAAEAALHEDRCRSSSAALHKDRCHDDEWHVSPCGGVRDALADPALAPWRPREEQKR